MDLSKKCKEYWGFDPAKTPFGMHIEEPDALFVWPEFGRVVDRIVRAIKRRQYLVLVGLACSAKTTAWAEAARRLREERSRVTVCQPRALDPRDYNEQTVYRVLVSAMTTAPLRQAREARALQVRELLQEQNTGGTAVVFAVNDAHKCDETFLLLTKRLWDDLDGFDRLLSVLLVGQPDLMRLVSGCREINERTEVVRMPGLGKHVRAYVEHECTRCGASEFPFDDSAIRAIERLRHDRWEQSHDHPLIVNNLAGAALHLAWDSTAQVVTDVHVNEAFSRGRFAGMDA